MELTQEEKNALLECIAATIGLRTLNALEEGVPSEHLVDMETPTTILFEEKAELYELYKKIKAEMPAHPTS